MKVRVKILENVAKEEKSGTGPGQTFPVPTMTQAVDEPVAGYLLQRLEDAWPSLASVEELERLEKRLESRIEKLEDRTSRNMADSTKIPTELREIISQEATMLVLENIDDCDDIRLDDIERLEDLFAKICELFDEYITDREAEITREQEPVDSEVPDGMSGIGGEGRPMPADEPSSQTHTVVAGDTYWEIARKYLGNPLRWKEVMNANMDFLKNRPKKQFRLTPEKIPVIRPGDELQIPPR